MLSVENETLIFAFVLNPDGTLRSCRYLARNPFLATSSYIESYSRGLLLIMSHDVLLVRVPDLSSTCGEHWDVLGLSDSSDDHSVQPRLPQLDTQRAELLDIVLVPTTSSVLVRWAQDAPAPNESGQLRFMTTFSLVDVGGQSYWNYSVPISFSEDDHNVAEGREVDDCRRLPKEDFRATLGTLGDSRFSIVSSHPKITRGFTIDQKRRKVEEVYTRISETSESQKISGAIDFTYLNASSEFRVSNASTTATQDRAVSARVDEAGYVCAVTQLPMVVNCWAPNGHLIASVQAETHAVRIGNQRTPFISFSESACFVTFLDGSLLQIDKTSGDWTICNGAFTGKGLGILPQYDDARTFVVRESSIEERVPIGERGDAYERFEDHKWIYGVGDAQSGREVAIAYVDNVASYFIGGHGQTIQVVERNGDYGAEFVIPQCVGAVQRLAICGRIIVCYIDRVECPSRIGVINIDKRTVQYFEITGKHRDSWPVLTDEMRARGEIGLFDGNGTIELFRLPVPLGR